ncbi:hypothetical protein Patl1_32789 [Pistacia atlantica]|uniref:Uncharacterized protein n=1 Tax=Pistacia atlantica TaxID=434234 RepID=A0ACC1AQ25_9ROSI|nr:hypothetical protein Patl1_32789 [Pistacia atlantica]
MPTFHIDTQRDIVLATMAIHNYIRKKNTPDMAFQVAENETYVFIRWRRSTLVGWR